MTDRQNFQFDVFLSHNGAQKDWTEALARRLRDDGFRVWFDKWEMPRHLGKGWIDVLADSVEQTRQVVLVWSPEFFSHDWPKFESTIVQMLDPVGDKGRILPLIHTACNLPARWRFLQGLPFDAAEPGSMEFEFRYQQLLYNLDNSRPFEGDSERFKAQHAAKGGKDHIVTPVRPLPRDLHMPHIADPIRQTHDHQRVMHKDEIGTAPPDVALMWDWQDEVKRNLALLGHDSAKDILIHNRSSEYIYNAQIADVCLATSLQFDKVAEVAPGEKARVLARWNGKSSLSEKVLDYFLCNQFNGERARALGLEKVRVRPNEGICPTFLAIPLVLTFQARGLRWESESDFIYDLGLGENRIERVSFPRPH